MTQVDRLRRMLSFEHHTYLTLNSRNNAKAAVEALHKDPAGKLAVLTLLDEIEHEDTVESLDKAGM